MKNLKDILFRVSIESVYGSTDLGIASLEFDSRAVNEKSLFVAISGTVVDGHQFIEEVTKAGVKAIICERLPSERKDDVTYVVVNDSKEALAILAANFYGNPSQKIQLIGITGTNGKTTVATLLYNLFKNAGYKVGLLSTVKILIGEQEFPATHTTPDSVTINKYLDQMVNAEVDYCFMEVSSHGIDQKRTSGLHFAGGVFTNLSHDHLDYHKSFAAYRDTKKRFFDELPKTAFALTNIDDKNGKVMLQNTDAKKYTYALKTIADYKAKILENQLSGLLLTINNNEVWTKLIGNFNAYNVLAIYATADLLGIEEIENLRLLSELESVSGRFQYLISNKGVVAIIDYAHTPDALKNVLETINAIRTHNEKVITVVGCGGDRDKAKRPKMAHIASELSNQAIFTSDNPRSEDPQAIIEDMEAGIQPQNYKKTLSIVDRKQAIKTASQLAEKGDIVLIAGKGHETYQDIKGVKTDFDDYAIVKDILEELEK
ncbi:MAG: UDP-N-acetylmuramoyl-L-alanyl-D-glutamate--2,6-diaminopimelate ligase [Flavobacteriaceae bacterium]|nr:UDP-N-acetylmuramoyl-L-alanyl-D-glutamate--2,6-diaminopimelate ligase [Flavobacteriaceae bacterium]